MLCTNFKEAEVLNLGAKKFIKLYLSIIRGNVLTHLTLNKFEVFFRPLKTEQNNLMEVSSQQTYLLFSFLQIFKPEVSELVPLYLPLFARSTPNLNLTMY